MQRLALPEMAVKPFQKRAKNVEIAVVKDFAVKWVAALTLGAKKKFFQEEVRSPLVNQRRDHYRVEKLP